MNLPKTGEVYEHYKDGQYYRVVGLARDDKGLLNVIYTPLYKEDVPVPPPLYSNPIERFMQTMENHEPRFLLCPKHIQDEYGLGKYPCYYINKGTRGKDWDD